MINVGPLKVRGTPLVAGDTAYIPSMDTDSITAFGAREYARPSPLFTDIGQAQAYADGIVGRRKSPHGWLVARWPAYYAVVNAQMLELSRRITVERLGATQDYYIEGVSIAQRRVCADGVPAVACAGRNRAELHQSSRLRTVVGQRMRVAVVVVCSLQRRVAHHGL